MNTKEAILHDLRAHAYLDRVLPDVRIRKVERALEVGCTRREIAEAQGVSVQALGRFIDRNLKGRRK